MFGVTSPMVPRMVVFLLVTRRKKAAAASAHPEAPIFASRRSDAQVTDAHVINHTIDPGATRVMRSCAGHQAEEAGGFAGRSDDLKI